MFLFSSYFWIEIKVNLSYSLPYNTLCTLRADAQTTRNVHFLTRKTPIFGVSPKTTSFVLISLASNTESGLARASREFSCSVKEEFKRSDFFKSFES